MNMTFNFQLRDISIQQLVYLHVDGRASPSWIYQNYDYTN